MKHLFKVVSPVVLVALVVLVSAACEGSQGLRGDSGAQGTQGPQGPQGSQGLQGADGSAGPASSAFPTAIMLVPTEAEEGRPTITVFGSGWQLDEAITIEAYGPDGYHVFIGGAMADASGTFETEIRARSRVQEGGPFEPGLYSIVALGSKNGGASASLVVTAAAP
ncbi:MAG: hypothetical protein V3S37_02590 [Dehalococcoidia bacterium]